VYIGGGESSAGLHVYAGGRSSSVDSGSEVGDRMSMLPVSASSASIGRMSSTTDGSDSKSRPCCFFRDDDKTLLVDEPREWVGRPESKRSKGVARCGDVEESEALCRAKGRMNSWVERSDWKRLDLRDPRLWSNLIAVNKIKVRGKSLQDTKV